jgi:hypothetical protein
VSVSADTCLLIYASFVMCLFNRYIPQGSSMFMSEVPKHIIANPHLDSGIGPGSYNHPKLTSVCVQAPFKNKRNRFAPMAAPTSTMVCPLLVYTDGEVWWSVCACPSSP